jgi:hypothetical protein
VKSVDPVRGKREQKPKREQKLPLDSSCSIKLPLDVETFGGALCTEQHSVMYYLASLA